jgi:exopolysaccharide biosynthesis polyprenyl glycosylphosphotransferase
MADLLRAPEELTKLQRPIRLPVRSAVDPPPPLPRPAATHRLTRPLERSTLLGLDVLTVGGAEWYALDDGAHAWAAVASCLLGALIGLLCLGMNRPKLRLSTLDDTPRLLAGAGAGAALALAFLWTVDPRTAKAGELEPAVAAAAIGVITSRVLGYGLLRTSRRHRRGSPTLIIGTGVVAAQLSRALLEDRRYGLTPIGQVISGARFDDTPLISVGATEDLPQLLRVLAPTHVLVAFSEQREADLIDVLRACRGTDADVLCVPRLFEVHPRAAQAEEIASVPLIRLCRADSRRFGRSVKRATDVVLAGLALLLLSPVMLACAALVRMEGGPGVLFRQERVGRDGRPFTLLKFRSLRPVDEQESATLWSVAYDERLGPVGRVLRVTSFDELPQLINILRGEMSLVGPRPERPHFVAEFAQRHARYAHRHRAPVGLTGWAQVNGLRGDTSIADRVQLDNWYIENWSLWLDAKIILRTVGAVIRELTGPDWIRSLKGKRER